MPNSTNSFFNDSTILLDIDAQHLSTCYDIALSHIEADSGLPQATKEAIKQRLNTLADASIDFTEHSIAIAHQQIDAAPFQRQFLLRLQQPLQLHTNQRHSTQFIWLLLSNEATHPHIGSAVEFAHLMGHEPFRSQALQAASPQELCTAYEKELSDEVHMAHAVPEELQSTGRLWGGVIQDIKRRAPHYWQDFQDGIQLKTLGSSLFLFFACLAPAVAFGGLLSLMTEGTIGAIEMLIATAGCGLIYALTAGQPLTIIGSTGPVVIFMGALYRLCQHFQIPYLPTMCWVGLWTMLFLLILAATDACRWIRYFTRFTDDIFAALISLIFIAEALNDIAAGFSRQQPPTASALLVLVLSLGTFMIASGLSRFRQSVFLRRKLREFLADFGPSIAIAMMTLAAFAFPHISIPTLQVPDHVTPSIDRTWLVNPLTTPTWVWLATAIPAALVSLLLFLDQNITVRLVNAPEYKLKKGSGYHLDLAIIGVLVGICSMFGLPWMVAATVRSLNHVRSLATVECIAQKDSSPQEQVTSVLETRLSGLLVHIFMAASLLLLPYLSQIPMAVLFGLFLFMGIASLKGNQFFERIKGWATDPSLYRPTHFLRAVPRRAIHLYTAIQMGCLAVLWAIKASSLAILFPLFIGFLVPVRMHINRYFKPAHLALLDAEEIPEDDEMREVD